MLACVHYRLFVIVLRRKEDISIRDFNSSPQKALFTSEVLCVVRGI